MRFVLLDLYCKCLFVIQSYLGKEGVSKTAAYQRSYTTVNIFWSDLYGLFIFIASYSMISGHSISKINETLRNAPPENLENGYFKNVTLTYDAV